MSSDGHAGDPAASPRTQNGNGAAALEASGSKPVLRAPEELTPLPAVDAAMPLLEHFALVVGRKRARFKIALLKSLQSDGAGRWKIRRLQEVVHWLEPGSVTAIVADLRLTGVLDHEHVTGFYRLTPNARVITALLDALTIPEVHPRSLIRFLNKAMALAQAGGAGEDAVLRQFQSAVAVLRGDWEDLVRLLDDHSDAALLEAAELVRIHVDDMRELLDEHQSFFAAHRDSADFLDADQEALDLVARLGTMSAEVIDAVSGRAEERMKSGVRFDRSDVREFVASSPDADIAALVSGLVLPAPYVVAISPATSFEAMLEATERIASVPPPLPAPARPDQVPPEEGFDLTESIRDEVVGLSSPATVAELTVRSTWEESIARHSALLDAYSRWQGLPLMDHGHGYEEPSESEVWRVSRTKVGEVT